MVVDRSQHAIELGYAGEQAVKELLEKEGFKVTSGEPGSYDLLIEDLTTVEVKTASLSGRTDKQAKRWQFCFYSHPDRQQPLVEDLLILRCESNPPCHFIIPFIFVPEGLTKIDITNPDPWAYRGKWSLFRELWELVDICITYSYFSGIVPGGLND